MDKKKFNINLDDSAFTKARTPVAPLFKPSSKGSQEGTSSVQTAQQTAGQPSSYAEFIIQTKHNRGAGVGSERSHPPQVTTGHHEDTRPKVTQGAGGVNTTPSVLPGNPQVQPGPNEGPEKEAAVSLTTAVQDGRDQGAEEEVKDDGRCIAPHLLGSGSSIIVSPRQRGNPILKFVRNVPWEFGEIVPDYVLGRTTCALFLSLRYHNLNPNYIHDRLKQLGQTFMLRVLLVQVDMKDPHHALKELARICIMADCTLILAWSPEEAGRYLETYKSYEKKPADILKEQVERDYLSTVTDCLTTVKSVNKTDVITLLNTFSSLEGIINASKEELVLCPGLGPQKARRLYDVLHQPFVKSRKKDG